eukprot:CAMPEP_0113557654 /NCGR_PEP_ID=MMETSP0015_2-20120614/17910_1 /TAXON_ID=2838 /ORGANISM="Odontella" /LENGTH=127 /DNA_ID=CAMNT_0000459101 /DNA_START=35 /DNA_END=415 /DNA_ORIENTATION=+ /assembly_acc=CAM_ASM_000160
MTTTSGPSSSLRTSLVTFTAASAASFLLLILALTSTLITETMASSSSAAAGKIKNVAIVIAMEAEASPFIKHLNLDPHPLQSFFPPEAPFVAYSGKHGECSLTVVTSGKDKVYGTGVDNVGTVSAGL